MIDFLGQGAFECPEEEAARAVDLLPGALQWELEAPPTASTHLTLCPHTLGKEGAKGTDDGEGDVGVAAAREGGGAAGADPNSRLPQGAIIGRRQDVAAPVAQAHKGCQC